MRITSIALMITAALSVTFAMAHADELVVRGLRYSDVQVADLTGGQIVFRTPGGNSVTKSLEEVRRITLSGSDDFNKAEDAMDSGMFDLAGKYYERAAKSATEDWQKELIKLRQATMTQRKANPRTADSSATQPTTPPPTAPAPKIEPPKVEEKPKVPDAPKTSEPKTPDADTAADGVATDGPGTVEAIGEIIKTAPRDPKTTPGWDKKTKIQQDIALREYKTEMDAWWKKTRLKGTKVTWVIRLAKFDPASETQFALAGTSKTDIQVSVQVNITGDPNRVPQFKPEQWACIRGTLDDLLRDDSNRDDSIFARGELKINAVIKDATLAMIRGPIIPKSKTPPGGDSSPIVDKKQKPKLSGAH